MFSHTNYAIKKQSAISQPNNDTSITAKLYSTLPIKNARKSASYWDNGNYFPINSQIALNKTEKYKENMCIKAWLDQEESFFQPFNKKIWAAITST